MTAMPPVQDIEADLDRLLVCYGKLVDITRDLPDADSDSDTAILHYVESRKTMLDEVELIQSRLTPIWDRWEQDETLVPESHRETLREKKASLTHLLESLIELENRRIESVQKSRSQTSDRLQTLDRGVKMARAYSKFRPAPPAGNDTPPPTS